MREILTTPASPSTSRSLSAGLERDKSRQRDLPGDQLESWASPEDQVGDSHLARGSRRGAGSRGAHKRGWKHDRELLCTAGPNPGLAALPRCVCVGIQPGCAGGSGAGMPAWRPRHQHSARCQACFVSCAGCALSHGLAVHLRDPERPAGNSRHSALMGITACPIPGTGINQLPAENPGALLQPGLR